ncbi:MAG: hypothetical protein WCG08_17035, partial [Paludibacter sp.]
FCQSVVMLTVCPYKETEANRNTILIILFMSFFLFLNCRLTTEAMGIWRFAGAFAVVERQSECGSKTAEMHFNQPMRIGVC